ncbi:hypothetical protein FM103_08090 [Corynebacterium xerosis]|uniref:hypothetical protein n=1 Tax=Brachybacterium tyrofermentans TaxID=47848 RepID=UPI000A1A43AD|nr:hypothetical protein FM103_08090 [Corynebacterium xerosis]
MTGKTASETYAVIEAPASGGNSFTWTATIHRRGFKRTETLFAYTESALREQCMAKRVTRFETVQGSD